MTTEELIEVLKQHPRKTVYYHEEELGMYFPITKVEAVRLTVAETVVLS